MRISDSPVLDVEGAAVFEAENHAPIGAHGSRPRPGAGALERMKVEGRQIRALKHLAPFSAARCA